MTIVSNFGAADLYTDLYIMVLGSAYILRVNFGLVLIIYTLAAVLIRKLGTLT